MDFSLHFIESTESNTEDSYLCRKTSRSHFAIVRCKYRYSLFVHRVDWCK